MKARDAAALRRSVYDDPRWRHLRERQLRRAPRCAWCAARGPRMQVDHVVPIAADPVRAFDPRNLQTLCAGCHRRKDAALQGRGYAAAVGADGFPLDPRHPWHSG